MAKFSQMMLRGMLDPSRAQAYSQVGQNIGQIPGIMALNRDVEAKQAETQRLLQENANNPARLQQLAQEYLARGDKDAAQAFTNAATQATSAQEKRMATTEESVERARGRYDALKAARGETDTAFDEAVTFRRVLEDARDRVFDEKGNPKQEATEKEKKLFELLKTRAITPSQYSEQILKEPKDRYKVVGNRVLDTEKGEFLPDGETGKKTDKAFELAQTGKYTPSSIQDAVQGDGSIDYSQLELITKSEGRGSVGSNVEKRNNEISAESTKASIGLARNRQLQQELFNTKKTTGILSDWRTSVLDVAGLRDAEEEAKTAFLRTRNTDIINSLPPGVASDTDVRIFSQGFPAAEAGADEMLRYLQAEERILAASSDMALVADRHLQVQIDAGLDATMVGFEDKKQKYASIMQKARRDIEERIANAKTEQEAIDAEREVIKQVSEVLGFVPKFYR